MRRSAESRRWWVVPLLGLTAMAPVPVAGQAEAAVTYRLYQGTAEIGRESQERAGDTLIQLITIPLVNLHLTARTARSADGRLAGFEMVVRNAAGDSVRGRYRVEPAGDSLRTTGEFGRQTRQAMRPAGPLLVVPPQSVGIFAELARLAGGRDTTVALLVAGTDTVLPARVRFVADTVRIAFAGLEILGVSRGGDIEELSIPLQRVRSVRAALGEVLPPLAGLRRPTPDYSAPPGAAWTAEEVRVPAGLEPDTFSLGCTLTRPTRARAPFPTAITITGSGFQTRDEEFWPLLPDYRLFGEIAERLGASGVAVLRCDDRGVGSSGGRPDSATTMDLAEDTRAQLRWLRGQKGIDARRIALIGHSEGGIIAPLIAAGSPEVSAVVLMAAPAKNGVEVLVDQMRWPLLAATELPAGARDSALTEVERRIRDDSLPASPWLRWFRDHEPLPVIRRLRQPVLILQGALDRQVTAGQADTLAAALRAAGNRRVEVAIFPGLNHLFLPSPTDGSPAEYASLPDRRIPGAVLDRLATWLTRALGASRGR